MEFGPREPDRNGKCSPVFDTGKRGLDPILVETVGPAHWVADWSGGPPECLVGFVPGVKEDPEGAGPCCERILMRGTGFVLEASGPGCDEDRCEGGVCLLSNGTCNDAMDEIACGDAGGMFQPEWSNCVDADADLLVDWREMYGADGLKDAFHTGTGQLDPDTDDDGCDDGAEVIDPGDPFNPLSLTDPLKSCSYDDSCVVVVDDCNENGVEDVCDITAYVSEDCNCNGVPDECEPGACCYTLAGYFMCVDTTEDDCAETWGPFNSAFQGIDTACPTEGVVSAIHNGVVIVHVVDPAQECYALGRGRDCTSGPPYYDAWITAEDETLEHQFNDDYPQSPAIPAGFFGTGSDPFEGSVYLRGEPLGPTEFGDFGSADTLVRRAAEPFHRCDLPSATPATVDAEVVALNLKSTQPITVTYNGGQDPEEWDVAVDLSDIAPAAGSVDAVKTHCNGGTYTSILHVQPRFTFTKVADPGQVRVLDTGLEEIPPVTLVQGDSPWTSDVSDTLGLPNVVCTDFHPGIEDPVPVADCDCNTNGVRDRCDIEDGTSADCNINDIPDECDVPSSAGCPAGVCPSDCSDDCNEDCVPDECEPDCNGNGVADECDIAQGTSADVCEGGTPNGIPDECEPDCNGNDIVDSCEIANNPSLDANGDGVLDDCLPVRGACCLNDGSCVAVTAGACASMEGKYNGDETDCLGDGNGDGFDDACPCAYMPADIEPETPCSGCADCSSGTPNTCENGHLEIGEAIGYICAWFRECHSDTLGAGQSASMWFSGGECYCWDYAEEKWLSAPCPPPASGCCASSRRAGGGDGGEVAARMETPGRATARIVPVLGPPRPGGTRQVTVSITIQPPIGTVAVLLEFQIPKGWRATAISDAGSWNERHRRVRWWPFAGDLPRTVTLTATGSADKVQVYWPDGFSGTVCFDGVSHSIAIE